MSSRLPSRTRPPLLKLRRDDVIRDVLPGGQQRQEIESRPAMLQLIDAEGELPPRLSLAEILSIPEPVEPLSPEPAEAQSDLQIEVPRPVFAEPEPELPVSEVTTESELPEPQSLVTLSPALALPVADSDLQPESEPIATASPVPDFPIADDDLQAELSEPVLADPPVETLLPDVVAVPDLPEPQLAAVTVPPADPHKEALGHLARVAAVFLLACALPYSSDRLADYRPWVSGEPVPVLRKVLAINWTCVMVGHRPGCGHQAPDGSTLNDDSGLLMAGLPVATATAAPALVAIPAPVALMATSSPKFERSLPDEEVFRPSPLPKRKLGRATRIEDLSNNGLRVFFDRLLSTEMKYAGAKTRIAFFGDSTNSLDGVTSTLRDRLQTRFGDGGPGFMVIGHFKQQNRRDHLLYRRRGAWEKSPTIWKTRVPGGRYGLGGIVSTNKGAASLEFAGKRVGDLREGIDRLELYYQGRTGGGVFELEVDGEPFVRLHTRAKGRVDRHKVYEFGQPRQHFRVRVKGSNRVALYGAVMEKNQAGVVLDNLSLVGAEFGSYRKQNEDHLERQLRIRNPDLLVFNLAGNMVGRLNPNSKRSRRSWLRRVRSGIKRIRAGAPDAACLVISPLDQGVRHRGKIVTNPSLPPAIGLLREVTFQEGCAFWDAWSAMGGQGAMGRWRAKRLGWSDLIHVTKRGHRAIGHLLADALVAEYRDWQAKGGPAKERYYRWAAQVSGR